MELHTICLTLIAERQAGKLQVPIFVVFGLTRPGIKPESTGSVADELPARPLFLRLLNIKQRSCKCQFLHQTTELANVHDSFMSKLYVDIDHYFTAVYSVKILLNEG